MKKNANPKRIVILTISYTIAVMIIIGVITYILDPYCHYRATSNGMLVEATTDERYINDGILRNFSYDAIITGSSMTEPFLASTFDTYFGVSSVKLPFSGASYKEINGNLERAFSYNDNIRYVVRGLDYNRILDAADEMRYDDASYPNYLYNDKKIDDIKYLLNKDVIRIEAYSLGKLIRREGNISFDEYANWSNTASFGKEAIEKDYARADKNDNIAPFSETDKKNMDENIYKNVISLALEHPDTQFYFFLTPYSIYYWDDITRDGLINRQLEAEEYLYRLLLGYDNIHVFSFFNEYSIICNPEYYKDTAHYNSAIADRIIVLMSEGNDEITADNLEHYLEAERDFYMNYDYDALFE